MGETLDRDTYLSIVIFTLEAMIEQGKTDPTYCFAQDLDNYYTTKIQKDNILSLEEFKQLYKSLIEKHKNR